MGAENGRLSFVSTTTQRSKGFKGAIIRSVPPTCYDSPHAAPEHFIRSSVVDRAVVPYHLDCLVVRPDTRFNANLQLFHQVAGTGAPGPASDRRRSADSEPCQPNPVHGGCVEQTR